VSCPGDKRTPLLIIVQDQNLRDVLAQSAFGWVRSGFTIVYRGKMENSDKTLDSSSHQQPPSKCGPDQAWAQLRSTYLRDLPRQLDGIRTILEIRDYAAIKKQAHRIKGTSGTYRLDNISKSAARLERLADSRNPNAIITTINKVMRLVEIETSRTRPRALSSADTSERTADD